MSTLRHCPQRSYSSLFGFAVVDLSNKTKKRKKKEGTEPRKKKKKKGNGAEPKNKRKKKKVGERVQEQRWVGGKGGGKQGDKTRWAKIWGTKSG